MRRIGLALLVIALVAGACGGDDDTVATTTTTTPAVSETTTAPPSTDAPADTGEADEWDPTVAEQLAALEAASDGQWTIESALEAVALLRPVFAEGIETPAPINVTRLTNFIADNFDQVPAAQWDELLASGQTARLVAYQSEAERLVYQDFAERMDAEFVRLTTHRLNVPIYVALSDLPVPFDVYAATFVRGGALDSFKFLFGPDEVAWQTMVDGVTPLLEAEGSACIVVLGSALTDTWSEDRKLSGLLHEVVHCHQNVVHPQGPAGFHMVDVDWMDEGYASWAGEVFFSGTLTSRPWWDAYLRGGVGTPPDGFDLFAGSYRSFGFYSMLATAGVDPWGQFIPWFNGLRTNSFSDVFRYEGMTADANQQVIAGWTASAARNNEFGPPWNSDNGPGIGNSRASRRPTDARVSSEPRPFDANPGEQRYWAVQFTTPPGQPSLMTIIAEGLGTYRWDHEGWTDQYTVTDSLKIVWCVGEDCVCEDGTSPVPDALLAPIEAGERPTLHAALFGGGGGSRLTASVKSLEEECEEEEEPAGPLDACLFGTWNPDPDQFQDYILTLYRMIPQISNLQLQGTIDLTFVDDGSFTHIYNGVEGSAIAEGERYTASWSGGSFGTWEASGGILTLNFEGSDIGVIVAGHPATAPSIPPGTVEAGYTCSGSTVVFDPPPGTPGPLWPLPIDWAKVR